MKVSKIALFLFIFFTQTDLIGQISLEKYEQESIYLRSGGFVKGEVKHTAFFSYRGLKKAMKGSKAAQLEYQRYNEKKGWGIGLALGGLTSLIAALTVEDVRLQRGLLLGGLGASIASIPFSLKSYDHLHKAVWSYNRDLLLPEHRKNGM